MNRSCSSARWAILSACLEIICFVISFVRATFYTGETNKPPQTDVAEGARSRKSPQGNKRNRPRKKPKHTQASRTFDLSLNRRFTSWNESPPLEPASSTCSSLLDIPQQQIPASEREIDREMLKKKRRREGAYVLAPGRAEEGDWRRKRRVGFLSGGVGVRDEHGDDDYSERDVWIRSANRRLAPRWIRGMFWFELLFNAADAAFLWYILHFWFCWFRESDFLPVKRESSRFSPI